MQNDLNLLADKLGHLLQAKQLMLAVAESCTGGQVAQVITSIPGSSQWFERGFVTYSNNAKIEMLGVNPETIETYGAVSEQTAREMAEGALVHSHADLGVSITGIAGPQGGSVDKPVGTVWFAWASRAFTTQSQLQIFTGDRLQIRDTATAFVLNQIVKMFTV